MHRPGRIMHAPEERAAGMEPTPFLQSRPSKLLTNRVATTTIATTTIHCIAPITPSCNWQLHPHPPGVNPNPPRENPSLLLKPPGRQSHNQPGDECYFRA